MTHSDCCLADVPQNQVTSLCRVLIGLPCCLCDTATPEVHTYEQADRSDMTWRAMWLMSDQPFIEADRHDSRANGKG